MDANNGWLCVAPEYPNGTYAYFSTIDEKWNSAYPYVVGPTFYGVRNATKVNSITESVSTYVKTTSSLVKDQLDASTIAIFPNPSSDVIVIQLNNVANADYQVSLLDVTGCEIQKTNIFQGITIAYFDARTLYEGNYFVKIQSGNSIVTKKVVIMR